MIDKILRPDINSTEFDVKSPAMQDKFYKAQKEAHRLQRRRNTPAPILYIIDTYAYIKRLQSAGR